MFGLYSGRPTNSGATIKSNDGSGDSHYLTHALKTGAGFDPTGLERAAKAAREIDASTNVKSHHVAEIILRTGLPRV